MCNFRCGPYQTRNRLGRSYYKVGSKYCKPCRKYLMWDGRFCPCCQKRLRIKKRYGNRSTKVGWVGR